MKKIFSLFIMSLMLIGIASCGGKDTDVETVKNMFASISKNPFTRNGYTVCLDQKYNVESHVDNEDEKTDYTYYYEGTGEFTIFVDNANYDNEVSEALSENNGYVSVIQHENISYECNEENRIDNVVTFEKYNYEITQNFAMKSYDNNIMVSGKAKFEDKIDANKNYNNTFEGLINKDLLNGNISSNFINKIFSQLIFMDGYNNINSIESYSVGKNNYTDDEIKDLLNNKTLSLEYKEKTTVLKFLINFKESINNIVNSTDANDANIGIKMEFSNDNYELIYSEYDLKDMFNEMLNAIDEENVTNTVERFLIEAYKFDKSIDEINIDNEYKIYTDPEKFVTDFMDYAKPLSDLR